MSNIFDKKPPVMLRACSDCEGPLALTHRRQQGVKCERFTARFQCGHSSYASETSLCLPLLA